MTNSIVGWLLKCYPSRWRSEYGPEMEHLLSQEPLTIAIIFNVLWGSVRERAREPRTRFVTVSALVWAGFFTVGVSCAPLVWRFVAVPAVQVLRNKGIDPPLLVATSPWEQALVIWLGIPLLLALFAIYPFSLVFAYREFVTSRPLKAVIACSAAIYVAGFATGFVVWQLGSFGWLVRFVLQSQTTHAVSVTQCFGLLAASTLGTAVSLQVPVALLHSWCSRAKRF